MFFIVILKNKAVLRKKSIFDFKNEDIILKYEIFKKYFIILGLNIKKNNELEKILKDLNSGLNKNIKYIITSIFDLSLLEHNMFISYWIDKQNYLDLKRNIFKLRKANKQIFLSHNYLIKKNFFFLKDYEKLSIVYPNNNYPYFLNQQKNERIYFSLFQIKTFYSKPKKVIEILRDYIKSNNLSAFEIYQTQFMKRAIFFLLITGKKVNQIELFKNFIKIQEITKNLEYEEIKFSNTIIKNIIIKKPITNLKKKNLNFQIIKELYNIKNIKNKKEYNFQASNINNEDEEIVLINKSSSLIIGIIKDNYINFISSFLKENYHKYNHLVLLFKNKNFMEKIKKTTSIKNLNKLTIQEFSKENLERIKKRNWANLKITNTSN